MRPPPLLCLLQSLDCLQASRQGRLFVDATATTFHDEALGQNALTQADACLEVHVVDGDPTSNILSSFPLPTTTKRSHITADELRVLTQDLVFETNLSPEQPATMWVFDMKPHLKIVPMRLFLPSNLAVKVAFGRGMNMGCR